MKLFLFCIMAILAFNNLPAFALDEDQQNLKDLLTMPYSSGDMVEQELQSLNSYFISKKKHQAYFNSIYIIITQGILKKIKYNQFENPYCIEKMLVSFSNLYRKALFNYYFGVKENTPLPWQVAFQANDAKNVKATVQLVLGMNAHIVHDLAITLDIVAREHPSCALGNVESDYFNLNQFFHQKILELNFELERIYNLVGNNDNKTLLMPINLLAVKKMVTLMRARAWNFANDLNQLNNLFKHQNYVRLIEQESYQNTRAIFNLEFLFPSHGL